MPKVVDVNGAEWGESKLSAAGLLALQTGKFGADVFQLSAGLQGGTTQEQKAKLKREAQNRADIQALENKVLQRQQEATALRGQREVEALKAQADQYRQQANMISQLTPRLANNLQRMSENVMEFADIQFAEAEYREMQEDGRLDTLVDFWNSTDNLEQQAR